MVLMTAEKEIKENKHQSRDQVILELRAKSRIVLTLLYASSLRT